MEKLSKYFTWKEALYLPQWGREADESDGLNETIRTNLTNLFAKMDKLRKHLNKPIIVHVAFRPTEYNKLVKGAPKSAHVLGKACDFHVVDMTCDEVRKNLQDNKLLEELEVRMEDLPGANWVHIDINNVPPGGHRFFKP